MGETGPRGRDTITTPMIGDTGAAMFAHLRVAEDGSAAGRFVAPDGFFTPTRHQRRAAIGRRRPRRL
ncbi:hypothetical protein AB0F88_22995 [Streptosporangium sp. NPDC023963]|uniref:hypothetical protein n=1 Tax=Streptosporangium sp. NPDC023963 TaxID=3155608 RepID=UPI003441036D